MRALFGGMDFIQSLEFGPDTGFVAGMRVR
jgi:hypothetical protein